MVPLPAKKPLCSASRSIAPPKAWLDQRVEPRDLAAAIGAGGRRHAVMVELGLALARGLPDVVERRRERARRLLVEQQVFERLLVVIHLERRHDRTSCRSTSGPGLP
jgi:hypothetical protein